MPRGINKRKRKKRKFVLRTELPPTQWRSLAPYQPETLIAQLDKIINAATQLRKVLNG